MSRASMPDPATSTPFDVSGLLELVGDDGEFIGEFAEIFESDARLRVEEIRDAIARSDARSLERLAHSLMGMLSNLGESAALDLARQLEVRVETCHLDGTDDLIGSLAREVEAIIVELNDLRARTA